MFRLPVDRIREGYYSDAYFVSTKQLLEAEGRHPHVTMQVFQRRPAILGGIDEAIAILRECAGRSTPDGWEPGWDRLAVHALHEGDEVEPWETVMTIEGDYSLFAHLETVYLGSLARRTLVMTNVRRVVEAAAGKPILFFPARHDHWLVQTGDGWAAHVAGAIDVADALGDDLWGVRLDTSDKLVDRSLLEEMGDFAPTGVNPRLVQRVRAALDDAGHERVRIVVSGGFDAEKIGEFERLGVPVDAYGVGSSLLRGQNDFTADVVRVDGEARAKVGRGLRTNERLRIVG